MKRTRDAFTLIELLVVIGIIMLLAGLLFPAFAKAKETARRTKAKHEVKQLDISWTAVQSDYRTWPAAWAGAGSAMSGKDDGNGHPMDQTAVAYMSGGNSKGALYLEVDSTMVNGFTDPWYTGKPPNANNYYQFALGASSVNVPSGDGGPTLDRSVACWSLASDGLAGSAGGTATDDVMSWQ